MSHLACKRSWQSGWTMTKFVVWSVPPSIQGCWKWYSQLYLGGSSSPQSAQCLPCFSSMYLACIWPFHVPRSFILHVLPPIVWRRTTFGGVFAGISPCEDLYPYKPSRYASVTYERVRQLCPKEWVSRRIVVVHGGLSRQLSLSTLWLLNRKIINFSR